MYGSTLDETLRTLLFSTQLSAIVSFSMPSPCFKYFYSTHWRMTLEERKFCLVAFCMCVGIWFGAFVIPLDWDVPWQKFPISLTHGSVLGFFVGSFGAFFVEYFEKIKEF
eukprot:gene7102-11265_t